MTRLLLLLALVGCGADLPSPVTDTPISCRQCADGSVMCQDTLDDCIVQGNGCCVTDQLTLCSDGVSATWYASAEWADGNQTGTWSMHDKDIVLVSNDGTWTEQVRLYYDGEVCQ